jgi:hypothetical protein
MSFGASYIPRFFITLFTTAVLGLTMLLKVGASIIYNIRFATTKKISSPSRINPQIEPSNI